MGNKVAAIDSIGRHNYAAKGHDYDPYLRSFIKGIPTESTESTWNNEESTDSILVIRGLGGGGQKAIRRCKAEGRDFYAMDTGYFGNGKHKTWHRITKNNLQNLGPIIERPYDRLSLIEYEYTPIYSGSKILICPPSDKVMNLFNQATANEWVNATIEEIKKYTDRPVEVRMKPSRTDRITTNTIQQALANDVHCLVTYNSIAATEALMAGRAAISLGPNAAQIVSETDLSKIENPKVPNKDEMMAYMAHLSFCQFRQSEMEDGYAWKILQETYT